MFVWDDDRVRFMADAAGYGDYHARLASEITSRLAPGLRICDAGCGTGHLSLALAPCAAQVTAVDISEKPLRVLANAVKHRNIQNIEIRCGDVRACPPAVPYDAMIFCFFGQIEEILQIASEQCRGTVLAAVRNHARHRFSAGAHPIDGGFARTSEVLRARGVPFETQTLALECGQPFRTMADARAFFRLYSRDSDPSLISDDFLRARLVRTGRADFPLYLPQLRHLALLRLEARDIK